MISTITEQSSVLALFLMKVSELTRKKTQLDNPFEKQGKAKKKLLFQ
jgi:hypothetical protein